MVRERAGDLLQICRCFTDSSAITSLLREQPHKLHKITKMGCLVKDRRRRYRRNNGRSRYFTDPKSRVAAVKEAIMLHASATSHTGWLLYVAEVLHRVRNEYAEAIAMASVMASHSASRETKVTLEKVIEYLTRFAT
jgi:hypothetical protein